MKRMLLAGVSLLLGLPAMFLAVPARASDLTQIQAAYKALLYSQDNLLANGDFSREFDGWQTFGQGGPFIWAVVDGGLFGSKAVRVVGPWLSNATDAVFQQLDLKEIGIEAGTEYIAYVWIKTSITSKTGLARLTIAAFDKDGNVVQYLFSHDVTEAGQYGQTGMQDWQLHRLAWIPREDVAYVTIQGLVGAYPSDGDIDDEALFDGFVLVETDKVPAALADTLVPKYSN